MLVYEMQKSGQYHIGRASNSNSNSISLTSKLQQSVSSMGNLQAEKADFKMQATYMLNAEVWACRHGNESIVLRFFTQNLFLCGQGKTISDFLFSNESLFFYSV